MTDAQKNTIKLLASGPDTLGTIRQTTIQALSARGLIESFIPAATTWTQAARGRVRYYRLTPQGVIESRKI